MVSNQFRDKSTASMLEWRTFVSFSMRRSSVKSLVRIINVDCAWDCNSKYLIHDDQYHRPFVVEVTMVVTKSQSDVVLWSCSFSLCEQSYYRCCFYHSTP